MPACLYEYLRHGQKTSRTTNRRSGRLLLLWVPSIAKTTKAYSLLQSEALPLTSHGAYRIHTLKVVDVGAVYLCRSNDDRNRNIPYYKSVSIAGAPNSPDPSLGRFRSLPSIPPSSSPSSVSLAFRSSSMSHMGLGGRFRGGRVPDSAESSGKLFESSSMSHVGLGSRGARGRGAAGGRGGDRIRCSGWEKAEKSRSRSTARSFPFPAAA